MQLSVQVVDMDTWHVLRVHGEIDLSTAPALRQEIAALIDGGASHLVIDLGSVDFCDSTGLGVLVGAAKRVRLRDGDIRVVLGSDRLRRIFEITRLDKVFDVYDDVEGAVA